MAAEEPSFKLTVRVDPSIVERLDALAPLMADTLGVVATRSDVARQALMAGLRMLERKAKDADE